MSGGEDDPSGLLHWPEEIQFLGNFGESEIWSLIFVESGLKDADLRPLAEHLRKGYPLSPRIAGIIADAIEGHMGAACQISAKRLCSGRPVGRARAGTNKRDALTHTEKLDIGIGAEKALGGVKRAEAKKIMPKICEKYDVSESTIKNARSYVKEWIASMSK